MPPKIDTYRYIIYVLAVLQADSLTLKTFCERMILVEKDNFEWWQEDYCNDIRQSNREFAAI